MHSIGGTHSQFSIGSASSASDVKPGQSIREKIGALEGRIGELRELNTRRTEGSNRHTRTEKQISGLEKEVGALKAELRQTSEVRTESARNVLISKAFTLAVVGLDTAFQALQYNSLENGQEMDKTVLATRGLALGIAVGDCASALVDYASKSYGYQGLQYGGDVVKGTLSWMAEKCGFSSERSEKITGAVSTGLRVGLTLKHLHSGNINGAVANTATMQALNLGKTVVSHELNTGSMLAARKGDVVTGQRNEKAYVFGPENLQKHRDESRVVEAAQVGLHALGAMGLPGGQLAAKVVGGLKAATDGIEAQAFQAKPITDKLGVTEQVLGKKGQY